MKKQNPMTIKELKEHAVHIDNKSKKKKSKIFIKVNAGYPDEFYINVKEIKMLQKRWGCSMGDNDKIIKKYLYEIKFQGRLNSYETGYISKEDYYYLTGDTPNEEE